jgi:cytochrome c-type biogenesis protein
MGVDESSKYSDSVHTGDNVTINIVNHPEAITESYQKGKQESPKKPSMLSSMFTNIDFGVFKSSETWKAFVIAALMFVTISFAALSTFDSMDEIFQSDAEPAPIPNMIFESLNRSEYEAPIANQTGWLTLDDFIGDIIILDFMARDCSNCHAVQNHLEDNIANWEQLAIESNKSLTVIAYGSWYSESLDYLNESKGVYHVPLYITGIGTTDSAILDDGSTTDPVRLFTTAGTGQIPVVMVLDEEGYIIAKQSTGTPTDQWEDFDSVVEKALTGDIEDTKNLRIAWEEPSTSYVAIFALGLVLSILVYFSPCAFPVLPGFISYYLSLGAREDELIESGKLKSKMPSPLVIGSLSGLGMWTFFAVIGIVAMIMGEAFEKSGLVHQIAVGIAILLIILGTMMLLGITSHVMGFVQKFVDKYSTTEADETFTPRRNMYLYGIGYAAASIDCTAAAVLPFVLYLSTLSGKATILGIGGLMMGLLILMIAVTMMVGLGRQVMINFLRRSTGMIKLVGSWMMIMAGISLTIYLTNPEIVGKVFG